MKDFLLLAIGLAIGFGIFGLMLSNHPIWAIILFFVSCYATFKLIKDGDI